MNPERPGAYEALSLEAAARVDAVCDDFEEAWKAARSGAAAPCLTSFLGGCAGPERTVLAEELLVLDRACRARYGPAAGPQVGANLGAAAPAPASAATRPLGPGSDVPAGRPAVWPSIPGLELLDVLGSGGMGVVVKARQVALDRDVAVKFLRDAHGADSARRERFLQEARAVARLRHPHLVQVYEFGEVAAAGGAASQPYLVLEYVSGGSLADILRGSPQPPAAAARLVEMLADAIHYAHQQGVIHRDLKPANILLSRKDQEPGTKNQNPEAGCLDLGSWFFSPKVSDFGLAKVLAGGDLTCSGDVLGTPNYMAPEQAAGQSAPVTAAVDVYGLGAILYEALTGRPPFAAATVDATLGLVRQDEPVPPRRLQPTVPRDLETVCLKCLRKESGRRYATARDLADDLRRFRAGRPVRARPVGTGERVVGWCRRRPAVAGLLAALVLVFLAGSSGVLWQWRRASRNAAEAEQNAAAFRRERDTARQEKERAERRLRMVRVRVDGLNRLGHALLRRPGLYRSGQAVLEEALAFYQDLLPEEGNDPRVRRQAAKLFGLVGGLHHTLGHVGKAAEAYGRQASLLASLLQEKPGCKGLRGELADSHRWRGNALRDLGKARQAREAYDRAAGLHEGLLREAPADAGYQVALANTLLNTATLLSHRDHAGELDALYRRTVVFDRAAVRAAPAKAEFHAELALALGAQGLFFLEAGRGPEAEAAVREALAIHQRVLAGGRLKGYIERYVARSFVNLGRVLASAGKAQEAEKSYQRAVELLDKLVKDFPESALGRADLARTLAGQANLLKDPGRRREAEANRRRAIRHYETLRADFPEDPNHRGSLAVNYMELVHLLWALGRQTEAAEPYRKALELDPEDPAVNNVLAWYLATSPEPRLRDAALAVRRARKAVTARPQSGAYRNTLGVAHYRNGDDRAAVAELERAMRLRAGGDGFDWFFLAMAHRRLGDRARARAWFDRAVRWTDRHRPHDDELHRFRAEAEAVLAEAGKR
jgi:tetratricopeptide (TPR) repeat protein/tRNA A-37 threonylcarbamoyl transferase component Bud32